MSIPQSVRLMPEDHPILGTEPALWALSTLEQALDDAGIARSDAGQVTIRIMAGPDVKAAVTLPQKPEAFALFEADGAICAWGHDVRGAVYALTELADRVAHGAFPGRVADDRGAGEPDPLGHPDLRQRAGGQGLVPGPRLLDALSVRCWRRTGSTASR